MKVIIVKQEYADHVVYNASTPELERAAALKIVQRFAFAYGPITPPPLPPTVEWPSLVGAHAAQRAVTAMQRAKHQEKIDSHNAVKAMNEKRERAIAGNADEALAVLYTVSGYSFDVSLHEVE